MAVNKNKKLVTEFSEILNFNSTTKTKDWWEKYMKHVIPFRGVGIPKIRKLLSEFYKEKKLNQFSENDQFSLALEFFTGKYSEDKMTGILFIQNYLLEKVNPGEALSEFEKIFEKNLIYDWNICDWFCVRNLGPMIEICGRKTAERISSWHSSENLWQARSSVVAFVYLNDKTKYLKLIEKSCKKLIMKEERFAKTAVGWMLREISKKDEIFVKNFVSENNNYFSNESRKNALKYL